MNEAQKTTQERDVSGKVLSIPVDIYEDEAGITLYADLPGVSSDKLNVEVEKDTLLIEGEISLDMPQGMEASYVDVLSAGYRRSFTLSRELEPEKIQAKIKDGVLTLHIPKREEVRPRKITVRVD